MQKEIKKIAMLAPAPFYYQIPLFRELAQSQEFDFRVYYCSDETVRGADVKKMYHTDSKFSDEGHLLNGYNHVFLKNYSPAPSFLKWPFGLVNPAIWKEIRNNKYDAIILQAWNNFTWVLAFFACLKFKIPVIFMTDANGLQESRKQGWKKKFKNIFLKDFIFKNTAGFLTIGSANENFYLNYGASKEKMAQMHYHHGYDIFLKEAVRLRSKRQNSRQDFDVAKDDFILLFVGRLAEDKNILSLLDAYQKVNFERKKLFIVGDGPMRSKIEKYIKDFKIEGVRIFGFQSRNSIYNFYNTADVLVLPSTNEPWGMVVNEAMCFSLPVIVSDKVGAGADLIKNNWNGFVFQAGNAEQLAGCIKKLIDMAPDEKTLFGNRSLEIIKKWADTNPEQQMLKIMKILNNNKVNRQTKDSFLRRAFYNPLFVKAARFLHLRSPLRKLYYFLFCPNNKILDVSLDGIAAKFYAKNPDELRLIESVTGDEGEKKVLSRLLSFLEEGDVVYDVGANVGVYSVILAKKIGVSGKVFAFEPEKESLAKLNENARLNGLENIVLVDKALGDSAASGNLYISQTTGNFSLANIYDKEAKSEPVEIVRGDDFVQQKNMPIPKAVKIDVEGYEYLVLKGLKETLARKECKIICCEIHVGIFSGDATEEKIFEFIKSLGFKEIEVFKRGFSAYHIIAVKK